MDNTVNCIIIRIFTRIIRKKVKKISKNGHFQSSENYESQINESLLHTIFHIFITKKMRIG